MCAGRIGDFQAIGYPGSFSLNFSLRSALLLEEKERCEEVTEEMEHAKHAKNKFTVAHGKKLDLEADKGLIPLPRSARQ